MAEMMQIEIMRYLPEKDNEPWLQTFEVPYVHELSLLDALAYIKDNLDPTLSFRWSCRMAICGSCGMMVNGVPKLGCKTFLRDYIPGTMRIEALANFPIERDLVVDMSDFIEKLESIKPYIIPKENAPKATHSVCGTGEYLQSPKELEQFRQFSMCINCGLCYAACPQYGLNTKFTGPAALALLYRYNADSRDGGAKERMAILNADSGVWSCTFVGYCSEVCPKGVDPASAIQLGKVESAKDYLIAKIKPE